MLPGNKPIAFIHVDVDDLWAVADCYGLQIAQEIRHYICEDALPRFEKLLAQHGIHATFFVVGADLESPDVVCLYKKLADAGHQFANHSYTHPLNFRNLNETDIELEVNRTELILETKLGTRPVGFRAPGYGASSTLTQVLERRGYAYDSSVMPGPYGFIFRWMDRRLQAGHELTEKTQYSRFTDTFVPLRPRTIDGGRMLELPVATSPLFRLPFQAGVCMRLGRRYFNLQLRAFRRNPTLPLLFLLHAADLTDFSKLNLKFFRESRFFSQSISAKIAMVSYFFSQIQESHYVYLTEDWIKTRM